MLSDIIKTVESALVTGSSSTLELIGLYSEYFTDPTNGFLISAQLLFLAIKYDSKLLVDKFADLKKIPELKFQSLYGNTPVGYALANKNPELAKKLLKISDPNLNYHVATAKNSNELKELIRANANLDPRILSKI
jgi:hypothetical protein